MIDREGSDQTDPQTNRPATYIDDAHVGLTSKGLLEWLPERRQVGLCVRLCVRAYMRPSSNRWWIGP